MKFSPVIFGFLSLVHSDGIVLSGQQTHHYIKPYCIIYLTALTVKQFSDRNNFKKVGGAMLRRFKIRNNNSHNSNKRWHVIAMALFTCFIAFSF